MLSAEFYRQEFLSNRLRLRRNPFGVLSLRKITVKITKGETPLWRGDEYLDEGVLFIRSENVLENKLSINTPKFIAREVHKRMKRSQLQSGDVLFNIVGASIGRACVYDLLTEGNINQAISLIRLKGNYQPMWLALVLNSTVIQLQIKQLKSGGARDNIDLYQVRGFEIPDHPASIQSQIIERMKVAYAAKGAKETEAQNLLASTDGHVLEQLGIESPDAQDNSLQSRMFYRTANKVFGVRLDPLYFSVDLFNFLINTSHQVRPLGTLTRYIMTGFAAGKSDQSFEEEVIQIRSTNISNDRELIFNRNIYIKCTELKERPADILRKGEVLFNNTNSQELVGKSAFFDLEGEFFCSNHITRIAVNEAELNPQFLSLMLNLYQRRRVFYSICTNWNNQSGVNVALLDKLKIIVPEPSLQHSIVQAYNETRLKALRLRAEGRDILKRAKQEIEAIIMPIDH